jgi:hypothetical protein
VRTRASRLIAVVGGAEALDVVAEDLLGVALELQDHRQLPPPVRLIYRGIWKPRFARTSRW